MAITIDFKSAKIGVDRAGAVPAVATGVTRAVIHLTRGFIGPDVDQISDNNAFRISGEVDVLVDTIAEADDVLTGRWQFGFIQIVKVDSVSFTWPDAVTAKGRCSFRCRPNPPVQGETSSALTDRLERHSFTTRTRTSASESARSRGRGLSSTSRTR